MTHIENIERKIRLKPSSICIGEEELAEVELLRYPTNCNEDEFHDLIEHICARNAVRIHAGWMDPVYLIDVTDYRNMVLCAAECYGFRKAGRIFVADLDCCCPDYLIELINCAKSGELQLVCLEDGRQYLMVSACAYVGLSVF